MMQSQVNFRKQSGVVLFVAMIALVVLMIAAVALIRSTDPAQMIAGNLAIKRDMTHESEQAVAAAIAQFSGGLASESTRWNDLGSANYSASALPSNKEGIPTVLTQDATTSETAAFNSGVTYRYVIDRMCPTAGNPGVIIGCQSPSPKADAGISDINAGANAGGGLPKTAPGAVYRISVRLTDSRQNQSFFQTTLLSQGS